MPYATLNEVWGSDFKSTNSKKVKKRKNKKQITDDNLESYYNNFNDDSIETFEDYNYNVPNITEESPLNEYSSVNNIDNNNLLENSNNLLGNDNLLSNSNNNNLNGLDQNSYNYQSLDENDTEFENVSKVNIQDESVSDEDVDYSDSDNDRLREIEDKLNMILQRLEERSEQNETNLNDIILFLIFGVVFIMILDMMFRFAIKLGPHFNK